MHMKLHVFLSKSRPNLAGFTGDETGCNLPKEYGPWEPGGDPVLFDHAPPEEVERVKGGGYALIKTADVK
jgi:hypothetical protein